MQHKLSRVVAATMIMTILGGGIVVTAQKKINVTGKWLFQVDTSAGSGTPTVTLKQDDETLTGHYSSTNLGEAELTFTGKRQ
jgi:hypothetical protein